MALKTADKSGYYEAREMGGGMLMLFDQHETVSDAVGAMKINKEKGRIRHCIVKILSDEEIQNSIVYLRIVSRAE